MRLYTTAGLENPRIDVADALRGIAVAGIILIHACEHFNLYWSGLGLDRASVEGLEEPFSRFMWWLFAGKMYTIFALLFGLSFYIQNDNRQRRGRGFTARFTWRMAVLFVIGMVNTAFYNGDVLVLYSLLGLSLPWLGKLPSRWLWLLFAALAAQPFEWWQWAAGADLRLDSSPWDAVAFPVYTQGGFGETLAASLRCGQFQTLAWYVNNGRVTQTLALFVLGMLLGRRRLFYDEPGNRRVWRRVLAASLLAAALLFEPFGEEGTPLRTVSAAWYNLAQTMAVVSGVVLGWYRFAGFRRAAGQMAWIGRMSLTNYLLQSVLGTMLFYNWGFGLYREVAVVWAACIGAGMVAAQWCFSRWWLGRFDRGPVEALWRRLTWIGAK